MLNNGFENLKDKRVIVTGATGGLGRELCFYLAKFGAKITLACRNEKLANKLRQDIILKYSETEVDFVYLDLSSFESVKNCINKLKEYNGIDIFINNAGVYNVPVYKSEFGFNNVFQINFISAYYLTKELMTELEKKENSRFVVIGSIAHNYSKLDENDIDFSSRKKASKIYGNSKRFLMFSTFELLKNSRVKLSVCHPGVTFTNMTSHYPKCINWLVKIGVKLLFPNPQKATKNILYACLNNTNYHEWIGPRLLNIWGSPRLKKLKTCTKEESQKIYNLAEDIYLKIK